MEADMRSFDRRWLWWASLIVVVLSGCFAASQPFVDDFSDPSSGWGAASYETYVRGYQQGRYLFQIDVPHWFVWVTHGNVYQDVKLRATVSSAGERDNHYGLICRYHDEQFYYFAISADGYYAIFVRDAEHQLHPLTGQAMLSSQQIRGEGAENHITALCRGPQLTLYVNGEQIAEVEDHTLERGDIGMAAGTGSRGGTRVWFDDFEVLKP